jgi:GNAT superfamily N-acetyltransferase
LRHADVSDAHALATLRRASLCELGLLSASDAPAFEREAARRFEGLLDANRMAAWIIAIDGRIAGSACLLFWERLPYPGSSLHAELAGVYIEPAHRRQGFARRLCVEAIGAARLRGARAIFVHPSAAGRTLYRELGFADAGQLRL